MKLDKRSKRNAIRTATFFLATIAFVSAGLLVGSNNVSANHPVLVEGNCDSPVPGTTLVSPGTCGDFDGDGRIGTAEDTDGADRIFGTINAALGPGTGAAAGTGANHNGRVTIVASGRFAEQVFIGQNVSGPGAPGAMTPGNVTLDAAPGVVAIIDAVLQGDPAGGNVTRQGVAGISVIYTTNGATNEVVLRNLIVRNFATGIDVSNNTRIHIDHCRIENNLNQGIRIAGAVRAVISETQVDASGFRTGSGGSSTPGPGNGLEVSGTSLVRVTDSSFTHNANCGIANFTTVAANVQVYKVSAFFNNTADSGGVCGPISIASDHNFASN